jgi:hypothetical protein
LLSENGRPVDYATLVGTKPSTGLVTDADGDPNVFPDEALAASSAF